MDAKTFNLKCAEFMRIKPLIPFQKGHIPSKINHFVCDKGVEYNPYSDANDRNKVIEKMQIETLFSYGEDEWSCEDCQFNRTIDKSMEAAQIKCIEAVLSE